MARIVRIHEYGWNSAHCHKRSPDFFAPDLLRDNEYGL